MDAGLLGATVAYARVQMRAAMPELSQVIVAPDRRANSSHTAPDLNLSRMASRVDARPSSTNSLAGASAARMVGLERRHAMYIVKNKT
jgi:hypothetical protein